MRGVSFIYDVGAYLETLDRVEKMEAAMFVPAHGKASGDVKGLVRYNRDKVHSVGERILSICEEPVCFERVLREVFKCYGTVQKLFVIHLRHDGVVPFTVKIIFCNIYFG